MITTTFRQRAARAALSIVLSGSSFIANAQMLLSSTPSTVKGGAQLNMIDVRENSGAVYRHALDVRSAAAQSGLSVARTQAHAIGSAIIALKQSLPGADIRVSNLTGAPRMVIVPGGSLTGPSPGTSSANIALDFLSRHGDAFGLSGDDLTDLTTLGDSAGGSSGLRMLRMEQRIDGRPIFQSETRFLLTRDGSLTAILGQMIPSARTIAPVTNWNSLLTAPQATARLLVASGIKADANEFAVGTDRDGRLELTQTNSSLKGSVTAQQIYFPLAPGLLVPAWSIVAFTTGDKDWYAMIDAQTGDLLWRKNIRAYASTQDARFRVYVQADGITPAPSPAPNTSHQTVTPGSGMQFPAISPTIVSMHTAYDPVASPNGWIDDCPGGVCSADQTQTLGNNVLACLDIVQTSDADICDTAPRGVLDGNGRPIGNPDANGRNRDFLGTTPRDFETHFLPPPQGGDPDAGQTASGNGLSGTAAIDQFRRGVVTHLFYSLNWYHDKLYELGFDEASGNFQQTNFSGMGNGNDRVLADVDDGSGTNNANFSTPPDGTSGRMQMYTFSTNHVSVIARDGALDAEVFLHEATHGVSNRLIGNGAGLNWNSGGGMGEGWSDFVALSLLYNTNADNPDARYATGGYATYKLDGLTDNFVYGIRRFPYSTDNSVSPLTWADVDDVTNDLSGGIAPSPLGFNLNGAAELHNIGEVWAGTLWEVRSRIIAANAGNVPTGNHTMLQLVIDAMKMTPVDPSFTDARDAILNADCATNACANETSIWSGFADRGLGYGAKQPYNKTRALEASHIGVHESFLSPYLDVVNAKTDVSIDDSAENHNGVIEPGETIHLSVKLTNPWRSASKAAASTTATLATTTPGVTVSGATASFGTIAAQGTAVGGPFTIMLAPQAICASAIDFTLTATSSLGTTATNFRLRIGGASGTDAALTYSSTLSPALAIPDDSPPGIFNQLAVTDDYDIADLNFRVDSITHTFVDDINVMLRSPIGIGTDMVGFVGYVTADKGNGDNLTNMLIDDDLTVNASHDMAQAPNTLAPYPGPWLPIYNSPAFLDPTNGVTPDAVGSLSRFDGMSTKGNWTVLAADEAAGDTGTLNKWSIIVTPVRYVCAMGTATAQIAVTKTVSGAFNPGGIVTYTIALTNTGNVATHDNPGDELVDVLPAQLTLLNASVVSGGGVATVSGNTAKWNGGIAAGATVTLSIQAKVLTGTEGQTVSNQATVSYDSNQTGANDLNGVSDDPSKPGASDTTDFVVIDRIFKNGFDL